MNFYNEVLNVLKSDERFFSDDGQLLRNAVYEAAMQMDAKLIKALYANEETRKQFFTDVDGIAVFDKVGFGWVINNREFLPDSYTRYKNKIGLVNNKDEYILILSRLVDTFFSRISLTMPLPPKFHNTAYVLLWEEDLHWQSRSSGCSSS